MKKYFLIIFLMLFGLWPARSFAASPPPLSVPAGLSLAEIKITGNEFLMIYNNSGSSIADLSKYWLYAFNNVNPLASGVSSSSQQLPTASLGNGQTLLLSSGGVTCGAAVTGKLNLSLNDSGGYLEIIQASMSNGSLTYTAGDALSWSSGANSTPGMIANLPSNSSAPNAAYYRYKNEASGAAYLWQLANQDSTNPCQLNVTIAGTTLPGPLNPGNQFLPGDPPPATFVTETESSSNAPVPLPAGLAAPIINELLPNPAEPQSDGEDEFIELYNPNNTAFDLSDFKLQTGTTTLHNYTFAEGTSLPAKGFAAFFSVDTNLSLSNNGSQARLLDPSGNIISQSEAYGSAKDGQSWALASGKWYWSTIPTPNQANKIAGLNVTPATPAGLASPAKKAASTSTKSTTPKVKAASTKTPAASNSSSAKPAANSSPLHPLVLAAVGTMAVAYAAYEYRHDLSNRLYQFRRHREARSAARTAAATTSGLGAESRFGRR